VRVSDAEARVQADLREPVCPPFLVRGITFPHRKGLCCIPPSARRITRDGASLSVFSELRGPTREAATRHLGGWMRRREDGGEQFSAVSCKQYAYSQALRNEKEALEVNRKSKKIDPPPTFLSNTRVHKTHSNAHTQSRPPLHASLPGGPC